MTACATQEMTPLERAGALLEGRLPDRVPLMLFPNLHGARELGLSIREYFSRGEYVAEGQVRMLEKFGHDCVTPYLSTPLDIEAWGGEVHYRDDGPPNSGDPLIVQVEEIARLEPPRLEDCPRVGEMLKATALLKERVGDRVPVIGVVTAPFSLPVMQLGFAAYLDLIYERPELFGRLMQVNEAFCVEMGNAQMAAGATGIVLVDPVASPAMVPPELYRRLVLPVERRVIERIDGPVFVSFASAPTLPVLGDLAQSGAVGVGVSAEDDLALAKQACAGRMVVIGNLNALEMRQWDRAHAEEHVKAAIARGGPGGGFALADNHGEIPWQVPEETIMWLAEAARRWGRYPLDWVKAGHA